jgi:hypothetical protein
MRPARRPPSSPMQGRPPNAAPVSDSPTGSDSGSRSRCRCGHRGSWSASALTFSSEGRASTMLWHPPSPSHSQSFVGFSTSIHGSTKAHTVEWWTFSTAPSNSSSSVPVVTPPPPASVVDPVKHSIFRNQAWSRSRGILFLVHHVPLHQGMKKMLILFDLISSQDHVFPAQSKNNNLSAR